jgi:hypothetical protein
MEKNYKILIDKEIGVISISFHRKISLEDMLSLLSDLNDTKDYEPKFNTVYDFTESTAIGYRIELIPFINRLSEFRNKKSVKKKVGISIKTPNQRFLVNLFLPFAKNFNLQVQVFDDIRSCVNWLSNDPSTQEKLLQLIIQNRAELIKSHHSD